MFHFVSCLFFDLCQNFELGCHLSCRFHFKVRVFCLFCKDGVTNELLIIQEKYFVTSGIKGNQTILFGLVSFSLLLYLLL